MVFISDDTPNIFDYIIADIIPATGVRITYHLQQKGTVRPGYLEVRIIERWCISDCRRLAEDTFSPFIYYLKPEGTHWQLAAWSNDQSVTCEYPDTRHTACKLYFWDRDTPWVHDLSASGKYN